jgi:Spy/CpxP family protein refolding chaperone
MFLIIPPRAAAIIGTCLCFPPFSFATAAPLDQTYAGQESRVVKSLSEADIDDLLAGRGWGFAKPAELNGYPGPAHVLEAADELRLSPETRARIEEIHAAMNAEARRLGALYVDAERRLEAAFSGGAVGAADLDALLTEAGGLRADLRRVHLQAHLDTAPLLTRHQKMLYARLRGYDTGHAHGGHSHGDRN